jgi:hypothetical protein
MNPLDAINQNIQKLNSGNMNDEKFIQDIIINIRLHEVSKYKLGLFLYNKLQNEIEDSQNMISNKINTQIMANGYSYNENKGNLFLHKKVNLNKENYFLIIHFKYLKPSFDKKKFDIARNELMKAFEKKFMGYNMIQKISGVEYQGEVLEESNKYNYINYRGNRKTKSR